MDTKFTWKKTKIEGDTIYITIYTYNHNKISIPKYELIVDIEEETCTFYIIDSNTGCKENEYIYPSNMSKDEHVYSPFKIDFKPERFIDLNKLTKIKKEIYKYMDRQFMFPPCFVANDSHIIYDEYIDGNLYTLHEYEYNTHECEYEIIKIIDKIHEED
jgi:hypothetical protein